jgi:polysaccharide deacetylase 2 family uncharacterized protein YibQ
MVKNSKSSKVGERKKNTSVKKNVKKNEVKATKATKAKKSVSRKPNVKKKKSTKKKNKLSFPSIILVGGIFFLTVILIIAVIMNLKVNKLKEKQKEIKIHENSQKYNVSSDSIDNRIKSVLFDNNITKRNILEHSVNNYSKSFYIEYKIKLNNRKIKKVKHDLYLKMKKYGFKLEDKRNKIYFYKDNSEIIIEFIKEKFVNENLNHVKTNKPKLSIILDDAGRDLDTLKKILKIRYPITIATIPYTVHDIESVQLIKKAGKTAFLHQPGEPKSYPDDDPGKGAVFLNTPEKLVKITIQKNFERLKGVDGFNTHMSSAITESEKKMMQILKAAKKYTNIFVDSRTSPNTVAYDVCLQMHMKCGQNKRFIDNELDHNYIKGKLKESAEYAKKHGKIIIIGHLKPDTVDVLLEYLPEIEKSGVKIVNINEVLD